MKLHLQMWTLIPFALCFFFQSPTFAQVTGHTATLTAAELNLDTTFYTYDKAWLEISGKATTSADFPGETIYNSAVLNIRHIQKNTQVERLMYIPVSVHIKSESLGTRLRQTLGLSQILDLKDKTLSDLFFGKVLSANMTIEPGFIDPEDQGFAYIIYSDHNVVDTVAVSGLLNIRL